MHTTHIIRFPFCSVAEWNRDIELHPLSTHALCDLGARARNLQQGRSPILFFWGAGAVAMTLKLELDEKRYVSLLENLIGEAEFLQNNPPRFVPQEDR